MTDELYSEEDFCPGSPGLIQVYPKAAPSPSPEPVVTKVYHPPVSSPSRRQKKANRRKTRPTQGDWVLIREMAPNQPDIAQQVSQHALNSDTESSGQEDEGMEDQSPNTTAPSSATHVSPVPRSGTQPFSLLQPAKGTFAAPGQPTATSTHRDSVLEEDIKKSPFLSDRRTSEVSHAGSLPNGMRHISSDGKSMTGVAFAIHSPSPAADATNQRRNSSAIHDELSTGLHQLQIPQSENRLPSIQPQTPLNDAPSPAGSQSLPPISLMVGDLARSASISEDCRPNGLVHRQSISSLTQSPTSRVRQMSISSHAHTPVSPFPLSASSPMSANSDAQRGDMFLRSGGGSVFGVDNRRPSQASETGRYPQRLDSTSNSEGYQSSDGPSPGSQQTPIEQRPRHMSLDGTLAASGAIILPPPNGSGMQSMGQHSLGTFRCDYPGCNALPFQTQYLLNSHTNVHSQNRPHYCPVQGCPRSEGGKGFKRKNEMIRHGLVHQSPGYVCPFCPDREHKYPRPDNLQRHVRVHHVDKDKDDPQLRDVLAQRPEGGSRGRRRRISG
ncbi:hypothetical protein HBI56_005640 [Parastagonospora nodorum]|nr:hypothetical protein HBH53_079790 [Parastagonospora nodorum]KAH3982680.1 hypothetical protein HBH51_037560 [Parastagonospora nodorum]KAH4005481.1 hypothetical protein HBI10_033040 [Parastagonospora nodorum]KAH4033096.1 hypothetical protein HBI13_006060 [Parastagonospora nodorum]KAH4060929.1 hypothetical protein HBH49_008470 [Parastagonospora nodorum]